MKIKKPTQREMVLAPSNNMDHSMHSQHLLNTESSLDSTQELKQAGYKIKTDHLSGVSRVTGRKWKIAKYILIA